MGAIIKIGTWDKNGMPIKWHINCNVNELDNPIPVMTIKPNGDVLVGNIKIVPWTIARKKAMEG